MSWARARAELLRAQLTADPGRGRDASALLLNAARRLEPLHLGLARDDLPRRVLRGIDGRPSGDPRRDAGSRRGRARVAGGTAAARSRSAAGWTSRAGHRRVRRGRADPGPGADRVPRRGGPYRGGTPLAAARVPRVPRRVGRRELVCALGSADGASPRSRGAGRAPGRAAPGRGNSAARRRVRRGRLDRSRGRGRRPGDGESRGAVQSSDARPPGGARKPKPAS